MNEKRRTRISKFLSLILRHQPEKIGLQLNKNGWADIKELVAKSAENGNNFTEEEITEVVNTNDKKRFSFNEIQTAIRANQGHSIDVEIGFEEKTPPDVLYHGTSEKNLESIKIKGLKKKRRHHVHLSEETETARKVGIRYGKPVIFQVDAKLMAAKGFKFYISANGVWLVEEVPAKFLTVL